MDLKTIFKVAINEADPEGLLDMGAPMDEYDYEVRIIYNTLCDELRRNKPFTPEMLASIIADTFNQYFHNYNGILIPQHTLKGCMGMAKRIIQLKGIKMPQAWVKNLVEKALGGSPHKIGDLIVVDGRVAKITGGQYWGEYGLSNCWEYKFLDKKSPKDGSGYGPCGKPYVPKKKRKVWK